MRRSLPYVLLPLVVVSACAGTRSSSPLPRGRLDCRGEGEPTIVFIPGASRGAADWDATRAVLGPDVRTCAWEPPREHPRTAGSDAQLLLAQFQGRARRWVLVGHSYGGLVVRMVAAREPTALAGAVFVDAVQEDMFDPAQAPPVSEQQPLDWVTSFQQAVQAGVPSGVPVLALVADQSTQPDWEDWLAAQRKLVAGGAPGEVVRVERSGHHIPRDRPDAIAQALRRLLTH